MARSKKSSPDFGTYSKKGAPDVKAESRAHAVQLEFDGYRPRTAGELEPDGSGEQSPQS